MKRLSAILVLLAIALPVFATDIQFEFDALKGRAVDYRPVGQICEQVARLELAETYLPGDYDISVGVEYAVGGRTIGELDVVVVEKASGSVALVGEVKCWKNVNNGLVKARNQRERFLRTLSAEPNKIVFTSKEGQQFRSVQFQGADFIAIAQKGSKTQGFDAELNHTLDELMALRERLMLCQSQRTCAGIQQ